MRKKVRNAKRASYNKFLDELEELPAAAAIERHRNGESTHPRTKQNEMAGPPVQSTVFSAYISSICTSKTEWKVTQRYLYHPGLFGMKSKQLY